MRRKIGVLLAVFTLVAAASGCSLREVQLWFAVNRKQDISRDQARAFADVINTKKVPGGCDGNYVGGCVPDNATSVHCAGTDGDGPAVRGPLTIVGWDSFELDPDGDRQACDNPVGFVEVFGQQLDRIVVRGWVFDPNTTDPVAVTIAGSNRETVTDLVADAPRPDLEAAFPGIGANHGFLWNGPVGPGVSRSICVQGNNLGTGNAHWQGGCRTAIVLAPGTATSTGSSVTGLIEGVDRVAGGWHVRGFVIQSGPDPAYVTVGPTFVAGPAGGGTSRSTVPRPDVDAAFSVTGSMGFDFLLSEGEVTGFRGSGADGASGAMCMTFSGLGSDDVSDASRGELMCRPVNT